MQVMLDPADGIEPRCVSRQSPDGRDCRYQPRDQRHPDGIEYLIGCLDLRVARAYRRNLFILDQDQSLQRALAPDICADECANIDNCCRGHNSVSHVRDGFNFQKCKRIDEMHDLDKRRGGARLAEHFLPPRPIPRSCRGCR